MTDSTLDSRLTDKERALADLTLRPTDMSTEDVDALHRRLPDGWVLILTPAGWTVAVDPDTKMTGPMDRREACDAFLHLVDALIHNKVLNAHAAYEGVLEDIETSVREVLERHGERA